MTKESLLSDQVTHDEIRVITRELNKVLANGVDGDIVEFGCFVGTTSVFLAKTIEGRGKELYLYDSFEGLPEKTSEDLSPVGEQFKVGELAAPKKQLVKNLRQAGVSMPKIKKAWFSDVMDSELPDSIAFAFLDGDYYLSVKDPLKLITSRLSEGAVIIVDDYANEALPGAAKAVHEWLSTHKAKLRVESSLAIISDIG